MRIRLGKVVLSATAAKVFGHTPEGPARYLFRHARCNDAHQWPHVTTHILSTGFDVAIYTANRTGGTFMCMLSELELDGDGDLIL